MCVNVEPVLTGNNTDSIWLKTGEEELRNVDKNKLEKAEVISAECLFASLEQRPCVAGIIKEEAEQEGEHSEAAWEQIRQQRGHGQPGPQQGHDGQREQHHQGHLPGEL